MVENREALCDVYTKRQESHVGGWDNTRYIAKSTASKFTTVCKVVVLIDKEWKDGYVKKHKNIGITIEMSLISSQL